MMQVAEKHNEIDDILLACHEDYRTTAKMFFQDRFYRPFDSEHDKIFDLLQNSANPRKLILAPRGTGKTSIDNLLVPAKKMLFDEARYIMPVGASATEAEEQSENLKNELMENQDLQALFDIEKADTFAKTKWTISIAGKDFCVHPRGAGQKVRGKLWRNSRPDLIIVDDIEDDEMVKSEDRREYLRKWFHGALMNTVDRGRDDWEIIVVGTLLHEDSLLANLMEDPSWDKVVLEICGDDGKTKFPNFMPQKKLENLIQTYRESGEIDVFFREYRNKPIATDDRSFDKESFKYYEERQGTGIIVKTDESGEHERKEEIDFYSDPAIENIIIIDPAKTAKMNSADSALVGGAIHLRDQRMFVRDVVSGKFHPDELYREMISMVDRIAPRVVGVEVTGLNEFVTYPIRNELFRHARNVELIELQARGGRGEDGKTARVRSLVPFYRQGLVYHNPDVCSGLESQLLSFPRSKRWDIMDALGYFVEILEKGQRYMEPLPDEGIEDEKQIEQEFRELEEYAMPSLGDDWRLLK